jgi:hypothetical protein
MIAYEVPIDWVPDEDYVNLPPDYEYLAWKLGTNVNAGTALWTIQQVVESPTVTVIDLLPVGYKEVIVNDDLQKFGHTREVYPKDSISDVESIIDGQKKYVESELA